MKIETFTHLHLHTEYSLLDGAIRLRELPDRLIELGMQGCAITDHGVLFGVIDFYNAMRAKGLKPIIGCEVYVAPRSRLDKESGLDNEPAHLVLLAENNEGYRNLMKLVSAGLTEGFYYRPRIDRELLSRHASGLIALSACLGGEVPQAIVAQDFDRAKAVALEMQALMGPDHYYLELQSNDLPEQNLVNSALIRISRETGIPLVATNDCHYLRKEDARAHDVLLCMQTGHRVNDEDRMRMESDAFYLKSPEEMADAFAAIPEAIENTARIASRCDVEFDFNQIHLPAFEVPDALSHIDYLRQLCRDGLDRRLALPEYGSERLPREEYEARLERELSVIDQMGFTDYFLIVWDFIRFAHQQQIMVGPGRGSGAGSLAAYCLEITNIDPLRYGLIFERFLNADRVSMPDFDIDFCYERRGEVIRYVTEKYGQDHVAQVITFGTLAARACIRDVARALDVPYAETDRIAKMIPATLGMTLQKALDSVPDLRQAYDQNEQTREVLDLAMKFEGMPRHASTHAAGVVIAGQPLTDLAPLSRNDDAVVVQFAKTNIELVGLLKFDFLGLRTLTVLRDTIDMVRDNHGVTLDIDLIPLDDVDVYRMIGEGQTDAVFQLESAGMTSFMKELQPENLEDIIAGISLYRPGPMDQIPRYVAAKHDPALIRYDHPLLEPILNVTYGCIVYQEQVMQIVRDLAGFSLAQSDNVRRAMSKKKPAELARYKTLFLHGGSDEKGNAVPGAIARGVSLEIAEKVFEDVMAFAGYAFNKSHAAAYALVAYHTAWLKYHYPVEFMAAMLNSYLGNLSQAAQYVRACRKLGIAVLPPDINRSEVRFSTENEAIRFALAAVKNVGESAIRHLIADRQDNGVYSGYGDLLRRLSAQDISRKMIESLIRASALDTFGIPRSQMIAVLEPFTNQLVAARRQRMEGQLSLFEMAGESQTMEAEPDYPDIPEFDQTERLAMEKEMLGLYISGHPLDAYDEVIRRLTTLDSTAFSAVAAVEEADSLTGPPAASDGDRVIMAGIVSQRKNKVTRSQDMMAFLTIEDLYGVYEAIIFPRTLAQYQSLLQPGQVLLIAGRLSIREEEEPKLVAEDLAPLTPETDRLPASFRSSANNGRRRSPSMMTPNPAPVSRPQAPAQRRPDPPSEVDDSVTADRPAVWIRFFGTSDSHAYQRLLALLRYFNGETPVHVYFAESAERKRLPRTFWVECSDEVLTILAGRCGLDNLAIR